MLFDKRIEQGEVGDVAFANGSVRFQSVKLNVYCYMADGLAIDAGAKSLVKQFRPFFEKQPIDALYCTHIHEDHTGGTSWFQERGIPIYIHDSSTGEAMKKGEYPLYRQLFWGRRPAFKAMAVPETFKSRSHEWRSIFTPGHSADHMAYLNTSTGQLFSGDLFVQVKTKVIMDSESVPEIIASLEHVLAYDFEEVFCNHAGYLKDGRQKLQEKLQYLYHVSGEVRHMHQQGLSVPEIQKHFFPKKYPITKLSFGQWDSKHIVESILAEERQFCG